MPPLVYLPLPDRSGLKKSQGYVLVLAKALREKISDPWYVQSNDEGVLFWKQGNFPVSPKVFVDAMVECPPAQREAYETYIASNINPHRRG